MTGTEFREALDAIHMSQSLFARFVMVSDRTVRRWASGETPVPHTVVLLLGKMLRLDRLEAGHE